MLRKVLTLAILLPLATILIAISWSCDKTTYEYLYVDDIRFQASDRPAGDSAFFTDKAIFRVNATGKSECCMRYTAPFVSTCYAKNLKIVWKNKLLASSFNLSLGRDILIDSSLVVAGSDLLAHTAFKQYKTINELTDGNYTDFLLEINDTLLGRMQLDTLPYIATFSCTTTDNKPFSKQLAVVFKK
jgi:hypothetical protein